MSQSFDRTDLYCKHLQDVDNSTLQQLFSKVAAVRSQNRELFDFTHREIEVFRQTGGAEEVVSEADVYAEFDADAPKNFATVIEGEVGTGKSELCAYLAHRLKDDGRPLLHVDKEDDLMTLLSERLPTFHREQFDEELEGADKFEALRDDIQDVPGVVANSVVSSAILNLKQRGYEIDIGPDQEAQIKEFIEGKLNLLVEKGAFATKIEFVSEQEFKQNDFLQIFETAAVSDAVTGYNEEMWRVVRTRYDTASISEVLKRIGAKFTDKRPVIVFEDFSITAMEASQLAKFIESDQTESPWDFIIAGTRDSTGPLHTLTAESRYEFYQTNKTNSQQVLFLDRDSAVDFIRPYLGYFKSFDGSVRYEYDSGTANLLTAPEGTRCAECGLCDESYRDLFPFNALFLERVYAGMHETGEESPREYIMNVFSILSDYFEGKVTAPSDSKTLRPLVNRVSVADEVYERAESFANLARWYGRVNEDSNTVAIDREFAIAFGLVDETTTDETLPGPVTLDGDKLYVPSSDDLGDISTPPETDDSDGDDDGDDDTDQPTVDPVEAEFTEKAPVLDAWKTEPGSFKTISKYLERGLEDALKRLTDDFALFEGTPLEYHLSNEKRPFVFSNTETTPDDDQIRIDIEEFRLSDLRKLLRFGIAREMQPRSANYDELFERIGTQLSAYAIEWREAVCDANLERSDVFYKGSSNDGFDDFLLAAYSYVVLLDSPWREVTAETVCGRYDDGAYSIDAGVAAWLEGELEHDQYQAIAALVDDAADIESMVGERFGVSSTHLDTHAVRQWFDQHSPHAVLDNLGRAPIRNISKRVRFRKGSRIKNVADTCYDVRKALNQTTHRYQADVVDDVRANLADLSMERLSELVTNLDTYNVDPDVIEPLKRFVKLTQSDVEDAVVAASMATRLHNKRNFPAVQAALASAKLSHSTVYERYKAVPLKTGSESSGIGQQFQEVAEFYVE